VSAVAGLDSAAAKTRCTRDSVRQPFVSESKNYDAKISTQKLLTTP